MKRLVHKVLSLVLAACSVHTACAYSEIKQEAHALSPSKTSYSTTVQTGKGVYYRITDSCAITVPAGKIAKLSVTAGYNDISGYDCQSYEFVQYLNNERRYLVGKTVTLTSDSKIQFWMNATGGSYKSLGKTYYYNDWFARATYTVFVSYEDACILYYKPGIYGTGEDSCANFAKGDSVTLASAQFARTGYKQNGWSLDTSGSSLDYELGKSYVFNASCTLYPCWSWAPAISIAASTTQKECIAISWSGVADADRYEIWRTDGAQQTCVLSATSGNAYTDASVVARKEYQYYMIAWHGSEKVTSLSVKGIALTDYYAIQFDPGTLNHWRELVPTSQKCKWGDVYTCGGTQYAQAGDGVKKLVGWQCSNGQRYDDGVMIFNLANPGETVTMTAIWE